MSRMETNRSGFVRFWFRMPVSVSTRALRCGGCAVHGGLQGRMAWFTMTTAGDPTTFCGGSDAPNETGCASGVWGGELAGAVCGKEATEGTGLWLRARALHESVGLLVVQVRLCIGDVGSHRHDVI